MLTNLHVKNLALIDEMEVEFQPGLNILTGETGAGKSMIIGSINLALGAKMSKSMIRENAPYGLVELVFQTKNKKLIKRLEEKDIFPEDGQIIISRKLMDGRSISKINGESATISQVKEIAGMLLDIHGQHEHQSLLYREHQLAIVDEYGKNKIFSQKEKTTKQYHIYQKLKTELKKYQLDENQRLKEISFLEFERDEIEKAGFTEDEEHTLENQYHRMIHGKKIAETLGQVYQLCGYESGQGAGELIGHCVQEMARVVDLDENLNQMQQMLGDIDGLLNDFNRELSGYLSDIDFSQEEFNQVEERLNFLNQLRAKYGDTVAEILEYQRNTEEKLEHFYNYEREKEQLEQNLQVEEEKLSKECESLSKLRKEYGKKLESQIKKELLDLNFAQAEFSIVFSRENTYTANGFDRIEFMISTNPGEPLKSLSGVVSGGELSRIMLAIKTILAQNDEMETVIFDEIDTGISGRTAQMVSEKMAVVSRNHQVLCITHLAQIAAMADCHFEIVKSVENEETHTRIHPLTAENSILEIARILGGAKITDRVLESAKEMKELAQQQKNRRLK